MGILCDCADRSALLMAAVCFMVIVVLRLYKKTKWIPTALLLVVIMTAITYFFDLSGYAGLKIVWGGVFVDFRLVIYHKG